MRRRSAIAFLVVWAAVFVARPAAAHKFHASLAEVDVNAKERTVEVGIRVFADDLEAALSKKNDRRIRLDVTPDVDRYVLAYLKDVFVVTDAKGRRLELKWLGMEARVDEAWLYVSAAAPDGVDGGTLLATQFCELYEDQSNTVNVQQGGARTSLLFKPGSAPADIRIAP